MSFESFLENITTFNNIDDVLVCEASFAGLRATTIRKKGASVTVGQEVFSEQYDLAEAVAEVTEKSQKKGWKGKHVVLVTPAVCMAVLDLAIPIVNKLPVAQLAETMQWEAEPAFNQHQRVMMIGQLLQYFGHLNAQELDEVLTHQNELANAKGNTVTYKSFGELAKDMFGIKQADLANCLKRQKWFVSESEGLKCGWHPAVYQPLKDEALYRWVIAVMNQGVLREWQAAFAKSGLALEACYPLVGGGLTEKTISQKPKEPTIAEGKKLILELHQGVIAGVTLEYESPQQIQAIPSHQETLLSGASDLYEALNGEQASTIEVIDSYSNNQDAANQLEADIKNILGKDIKSNTRPSEKVSVAMRNAVYHFFGLSKSGFTEQVSSHEPLPPVMQRSAVRVLLAAVVLFGLIALTELAFLTRAVYVDFKKNAIAERVDNIRSTIKRIKEENKRVSTLKADIKKQELEKKQAETIISLVSKELPERNEQLLLLLKAMEKTINEDIVMEEIKEDTIMGFKMKAWSINEQAAQEFVKFFQIDIHSMGYKVKDLVVTEETGRLGLIGYAVNFSITKLSDKDWLMRKRLGNRALPTNPTLPKR